MRDLTGRQAFYLALAVAGLCLTWYHNLAFMRESGGRFDLAAFVAAAYANHAAASLAWDITIACIAFLAWMLQEARRLGMRHAWAYVVLTFGVAFAFSAPLFLFMRERHLAASRAPA